jgi:hypothetical protein
LPYSHPELELPATDDGLILLLRFADTARSIQVNEAEKGESLHAIELFTQALEALDLTREETLKLWAVLECAGRVAKAGSWATSDDTE